MARTTKRSAPAVVAVEPAAIVDVMDGQAYADAVYAGIQDAMGAVDIDTAGEALDRSLGEYLAVVDHVRGSAGSRETAVLFARTLVPYIMPKETIRTANTTYGDLRLAKERG
jgi:hypothetical protein